MDLPVFDMPRLDAGDNTPSVRNACESVGFFYIDAPPIPHTFVGNPGHEVSALPGCVPEGEPARYAPTTVSDHLREMYSRTFA